MDEHKETFVQGDRRLTRSSIAIAGFSLLAVAGLEYVKWGPSWHRLKLIAAGGNMGGSILIAGGNADVSLQAAWTYAWAYGHDIWKALVLGLLLGTSVQALITRGWAPMVCGVPATIDFAHSRTHYSDCPSGRGASLALPTSTRGSRRF